MARVNNEQNAALAFNVENWLVKPATSGTQAT
jgi:hypothetical protein